MMSSLNTVTLMGNITRDIEMRYTPGGTPLTTIGIAMNRKWKDKSTNQLREEVTFMDCQIWGKTAEMVNQYFQKGSPIMILGRLKNERWKDKATGADRSRNIVVADQVLFCGDTKKQQAAGQPARAAQPQRVPQQQVAPTDGPDYGEGDVPPEPATENIPF